MMTVADPLPWMLVSGPAPAAGGPAPPGRG